MSGTGCLGRTITGWFLSVLLFGVRADSAFTCADDMSDRVPRPTARLIVLEFRDAVAVREVLRSLPANITADPESNRLLVLGSGDEINDVERLVRELDVPVARKPARPALELKVYRLRHRLPDELADCLAPMLSERGKLAADAGSRALLVKDEPSVHAELAMIVCELDVSVSACPLELPPHPTAERTIRAIDGPTFGGHVPHSPAARAPAAASNVKLQLKVCEINRAEFGALGAADLPHADNPLMSQLVRGGKFCSTAGPFDHAVWLRALSERGTLKIVAEPSLIVPSGHSASFLKQIGNYAEPLVIEDEDNMDAVTQVPGLRVDLRFLATVSGPEQIRLDAVAAFDMPDGDAAGDSPPPVSVNLRTGQLLAMSGTVTQCAATQRASGADKVPLLGQLLRSQRAMPKQTELLIMVIPEIISPPDPADIALEPIAERRE